jgi:hypothetical protein
MRNGIPGAYWLYRVLWSLLHVVLAAAALVAVVAWWIQDSNGVHMLAGFWNGLSAVQSAIANAIPFPWGPWS